MYARTPNLLISKRWPVDMPDMVLYDNGPRNYSIKRLTAGFKGLRLRTEKKRSKEDSSFSTTTSSITTSSSASKEDQDKENPLSVLRNRIAAPGVKRSTAMNIKPLADTTNTITSSSSELASSKSKTNAKIKVSSKASKRDNKKNAARRRRLQRRQTGCCGI